MSIPTERTRLLHDHQYVFDSTIFRSQKRRLRQFQCCVCFILMTISVVILLITISYSIQSFPDQNSTSIDTDNTTATPTIPKNDSLIVLISKNFPLEDWKEPTKTITNDSEWNSALEIGERLLKLKDESEKVASETLEIDSPSFRHQLVMSTSQTALNLSRIAYKHELAASHLNQTAPYAALCPTICNQTRFKCNQFTKYRTMNGSCNNLARPAQGAAYQPFRRLLPPDYGDGLNTPRLGQNGTELPSARTVSVIVHLPYTRQNERFTVMLAVWGQFLDHDITATALSRTANGQSIACCHHQNTTIKQNSTSFTHSACFPVRTRYGLCMEFVRSAPAPACCLGARQQLNQVTAYIDGSVIYGVDGGSALDALRTQTGGALKMYETADNRTLLPIDVDSKGCNRAAEKAKGRYCFLAGDARSNENLHLTSMHLIWARHHNRVAKQLTALNPRWNDERVFQETRRIIAANMQHITFNEFLPILFGHDLMVEKELEPLKNGYFTGYDASVDTSISNSFATAAFRFAHSIIPSMMKLLASDTSSEEYIQLHQMLFDPFKLYDEGELDRTLRGAIHTKIQASDPFFSNELKSHLFERFDNESDNGVTHQVCGLDLVSLNIQRGRDHGLTGYNNFREFCGLGKVENFDQLRPDLGMDFLESIKTVYSHVDDIDLYTGALSETPLNGTILGPTITCLLLDQFVRIKKGDRFWYENPGYFSKEQLDELRNVSLAKIICDNSDNVQFSQFSVMKKSSEFNEIVPCEDLPGMDLGKWEERLTKVDFVTDSLHIIRT